MKDCYNLEISYKEDKMKFDLHSIIILIKVPGQESMELKSILENRIGKKSLSFNEDSFTYLNVKQLIQYPTSEEFVFLELDSLKSPVVEKAMSLAVHSFYNVSFVMKNDFANLHLSELKDFKNQINGLKENQKINIRYNVFDSLSKESIEIKDFDLWKKTKHKFQSALIIGDIHEDVVALKALLKNVSKDVKIISVGDYLDKGNQTKEIISLIEQIKNEYDFDIVVGNHESFVARRLRKEIPRLERELDTFSSLKVLYKDDNLATRFLKIYDDSLPFLNFKYLDKKVVVTHAPCKESYLGKMNDFAQKSQRNFYFKNRDKDAMES